MSDLTGTWALVRLTLNRDRLRIALWIGGVVALVLLTGASIKGLYPTQAALDQAAGAAASNKAAIAFNGPVQGLTSVGGEVAFQSGAIGLVLVGLMSALMTVRCTRGEEESGRTELMRAAPVGRGADTLAASIVVVAMNVMVAVLVVAGLLAEHLPALGSVVFGVSFLALGLFFTALSLLMAQTTEAGRTAAGATIAVLGYAYLARAVGDTGSGWLSWVSPIGWSQKLRPWAGERWWPLLVPICTAGVLLVLARMLAARRDWGAGLIRPRPGPARADPRLGTLLGLAWRLNRGALAWWAVAMAVLGFSFGAIANDVGAFVTDDPTLQRILTVAGSGSLVDAYFATSLMFLAVIAGCFSVQVLQRLRGEETGLRIELVLATPSSRWSQLASWLLVATAGTWALLLVASVSAAVPYAVQSGHWGRVPALVGAELAYAPALALLLALACAAFGLLPRLTGAAWLLLGWAGVVAMLDSVLKPPHWLAGLSPFWHTPRLPAADPRPATLLLMTTVALVLGTIGLVGFRLRDSR